MLDCHVELSIGRCVYLGLRIRLRKKRFECFHGGGWVEGVGNARANDATVKMAKWRSRIWVEVQMRYSDLRVRAEKAVKPSVVLLDLEAY
jgi:hypothetical protein